MTRTFIALLGILGSVLTPALSQTMDRFHHPPVTKKINYDSLFAAAVDVSKSQRGQAVVQKCIERYGGREKLHQLRSARLTYKMLAMMSKDSIPVVKSYSWDRRYKISRQRSDGEEQRILAGDSAWFLGRDTVYGMQKTQYCAELFSYLVLALPKTMYAEPFSAIKYGTRAKDSLEYIYCRKNDSLTLVVGISPLDFSVVSAEGIVPGDSIQAVFTNKFSDFRLYDGFLFARQLINISMGLEVGRSRLSSVEVNPVFDASEFKPVLRVKSKAHN